MSSKAPRHFEFHEGSSNKFWEVSTSGKRLTTRSGKLGTKGFTTTKAYGSIATAYWEAQGH